MVPSDSPHVHSPQGIGTADSLKGEGARWPFWVVEAKSENPGRSVEPHQGRHLQLGLSFPCQKMFTHRPKQGKIHKNRRVAHPS